MNQDKINTAHTLIKQGLTLIEEASRPQNKVNHVASIALGLPILAILYIVLV